MQYNDLAQRIIEWTENSNSVFVSNIPTFVANACRTIAREVDAVGFNTIASVSCHTGNPVVSLPDSTYLIKSVAKTSTGRRKFLKQRAYDDCVSYWPDTASVGGNPLYYNRINTGSIYVVPTPTSTQELEVRYVTVTIPSSTVQTCYLLDEYPNLLLYRTMVDANMFLKAYDDVTTYQAYYDREREAAENEARRNRRDDGFSPNPINNTVNANNLKNGA